jgi:hypothetical protein
LPAISPPLPVGLLGRSVMQPTRLNKMADDIFIGSSVEFVGELRLG